MDNNIVYEKSKTFALNIIVLVKYLKKDKNEDVMSKQILRSGTSIGANIAESKRAQSKADFYSKMNIALKEAEETEYWLELLFGGEYIAKATYEKLRNECDEIIKILVSITKHQNQEN